jgi:hypothetical protein
MSLYLVTDAFQSENPDIVMRAIEKTDRGDLWTTYDNVCDKLWVLNRDEAQACRRVFHPAPLFVTLLGFHLLLFLYTRLETVGDRHAWLGHLLLPQLFNFVLMVRVFNLPKFMARVPYLPPLIIA